MGRMQIYADKEDDDENVCEDEDVDEDEQRILKERLWHQVEGGEQALWVWAAPMAPAALVNIMQFLLPPNQMWQ